MPVSPSDSPNPAPPPSTTLGIVDALLKNPNTLLAILAGPQAKSIAGRLGLIAVACLALFGLVVGMFSGGMQLWAAPMKIILGLAVASLMCLPSLYIFSCLAGLRASFSTLVGLLAGLLALTALLLAGFTPVVWIFGQSTESVGFMGALTLLIWAISLCFGLGLIEKAKTIYGTTGGAHLGVWLVVFVLVTLQMSTALRPILGPGEKTTFLPSEKMFFLEHWGNALTDGVETKTPKR